MKKSKITTTKTAAAHAREYFRKSAYRSALRFTAAERAAAAPWRVEAAEALRAAERTEAERTTYAQYSADAWNAVAYLYRKTPTDTLRDLKQGLSADKRTRAAILAIADLDRKPLEDLKAMKQERNAQKRIATSMTADSATRALAAAQYDIIAADIADIEALRAEAAKTEKALDAPSNEVMTFAADLVQVAALADTEPPTAEDLDSVARTLESINEAEAEYNAKHPKNPKPLTVWSNGEMLERARTTHRRSAVKAYIRGERGINALDSTHTHYTAATYEEIAEWRSKYADNSNDPQPTKGGTVQLVYREADPKKGIKAGYYLKHTTRTYRQLHSYEALITATDDEGHEYTSAAILTTSNVYGYNQSAAERIASLAEYAELNKRDRDFLAAFCRRSAIRAGAEARAAYFRKPLKKHTEAGAKAAELQGRKRYAYTSIGVKTTGAQDTAFSRLCDKLEPYHYALDLNTTDKGTDYRRMMERNHGTSYRDTETRRDLIQWTAGQTTRTAPHVVTWTHTKPQEVSQDELNNRRAALSIWNKFRAYGHHIAKAAKENTPPSGYTALNAAASALVFYGAMTEEAATAAAVAWFEYGRAEEQAAKEAAKRAADLAEQIARQKAAEHVQPLEITVSEWNSATPAQRLDWLRNYRIKLAK